MILLCLELMWGCWLQSRFVTSVQTLHEHQQICILVKVSFFINFLLLLFWWWCSCKMVFVVASTVHFNVLTICNFGILSPYTWFKIHDNSHTPKSKVASLLWFVHFDRSIGGGAQLLRCSRLIDHTSIILISYLNMTAQRSISRDKTRHLLVHHFCKLL